MSEEVPQRRLGLRPDARARMLEGAVEIELPTRRVHVGPLPRGAEAMLARLPRGATEDELLADPHAHPDALRYVLARLDREGLLLRSLWLDGAPLLTALPTGRRPTTWGDDPDPQALLRLSRMAALHREGEVMVLESPVGAARLQLEDPRSMALLLELASPTSLARLRERSELGPQALAAVLGLAIAHGLVDVGDEPAALRPWALPELWAHRRSRRGHADRALGKVRPFADLPPEPAVAPRPEGALVPLPRPPSRSRADDPGLLEVIEARRSVRAFDPRPPSLAVISELLFRTLRVRRTIPPTEDVPYERGDRPHPSAGACYPLEAHLLVDRCEGLEPGAHTYDPVEHVLVRHLGPAEHARALLEEARASAGANERPPLLLVLTARVARSAWEYGSLSHALIRLEAGVVLASLGLVATALGLGSCPLGTGDELRLATALGVSPLERIAVAEVMLGVPRAE